MKKVIFAAIIFVLCQTVCQTSYAGIYDKGAYWTIDKDSNIISKNSYPPDDRLLQEQEQICIFTEKDIPQDQAEYKNGKILKRVKTTQEIEDELKRAGKEEEARVIYKRMKKIAIDQLESEGITFFYNHLED